MTTSTPTLQIRLDGLRDPRIEQFMEEHLQDMRATSPPESVHALDMARMRQPEIRFWTAWLPDDTQPAPGRLVGTGALKHLDDGHAELKAMRTTAALRGQGIAARMLAHAMAEARAQGHARLSLETGSQPFFAPARALYAKHGFQKCGPFGSYSPDPCSYFMTLVF